MDDLLTRGITGLARAGGNGWFQGHFGAALIAAHFLLERQDLCGDVRHRIGEQAHEILALTPKLFIPYAEETPQPGWEPRLVEALAPNVLALAKSGHGVIYGSLALRALRERPALATPALVTDLERLLALTLDDFPNRYLPIADYRVSPAPAEPSPYTSLDDLIRKAFAEMTVVYPDQRIGEKKYYFSSEKLHTFTYARALYDLDTLGYGALARAGFAAHRAHVAFSRMVPPAGVAKAPVPDNAFTPYSVDYWQREIFDDHALKLAYAVLGLLDRVRPAAYDPATFWQLVAR